MSQQPIPGPDTLNLDNIQGDILSGLPKKTETYYFFQVTNVKSFRSQLVKFAATVKTVAQVLKDRQNIDDRRKRGDKTLIPMSGINVAFSHTGLAAIGVDDADLARDANFAAGQKKDAESLGDKGTGTGPTYVPDWEKPFLQDIHGLILVSGDCQESVKKALDGAKKTFGVGTPTPSIKEVTTIVGKVRPGKLSAHEHFGFLDGVSNPAIIGFDKDPNPGPEPISAGVIVMGHQDDPMPNRTPLAVDGSFLAFRYLFQSVPEFDKFLKDNPIRVPGLTSEEGSELLGARLVGRWKSGAPIDLSPFRDDPSLATAPHRNNNFHFAAERDFQKICPFAAHIRKTNPRADLEAQGFSIESRRIMRHGIQFGDEVTDEERRKKITLKDRGLLFVSYQSSLANGFAFMQKSWANNPTFPFTEKSPEEPGLDPIIGQGNRKLSGTDPNNPAKELSVPLVVHPRGGEYFFSPSLNALKKILGTP